MMGTPHLDSNAGTSSMAGAASSFQGMANIFHDMRQSIIDEEQKNLQREMEKQHHREEMAYKDKSLAQDDRHHAEKLAYDRWAKEGDWAIDREQMANQLKIAGMRTGGGGGGGRSKSGGSGGRELQPTGNALLDSSGVRDSREELTKRGKPDKKYALREFSRPNTNLTRASSNDNEGIEVSRKSNRVSESYTPKRSNLDADFQAALDDVLGSSSRKLDTGRAENKDSILSLYTKPATASKREIQDLAMKADAVPHSRSLDFGSSRFKPSSSDSLPNLLDTSGLDYERSTEKPVSIPNYLASAGNLTGQRYKASSDLKPQSRFDYNISDRDLELQGSIDSAKPTGLFLQQQQQIDLPGSRYAAQRAAEQRAADEKQAELLARRDYFNKAHSEDSLPRRMYFGDDYTSYLQGMNKWSNGETLPQNQGVITPEERGYADMQKAYEQHKVDSAKAAKRAEAIRQAELDRQEAENLAAMSPIGRRAQIQQQLEMSIPNFMAGEAPDLDLKNPRESAFSLAMDKLSKDFGNTYRNISITDNFTNKPNTPTPDANGNYTPAQIIQRDMADHRVPQEEPTASLLFPESTVETDDVLTGADFTRSMENDDYKKYAHYYQKGYINVPIEYTRDFYANNKETLRMLDTEILGNPQERYNQKTVQENVVHKVLQIAHRSPEEKRAFILLADQLAIGYAPGSGAYNAFKALAKGVSLTMNADFRDIDNSHMEVLQGQTESLIGKVSNPEKYGKALAAVQAQRDSKKTKQGFVPNILKEDDYAKRFTDWDRMLPAAKTDLKEMVVERGDEHPIVQQYFEAQVKHSSSDPSKQRLTKEAFELGHSAMVKTLAEMWGEWAYDHRDKSSKDSKYDPDTREFAIKLFTPNSALWRKFHEGYTHNLDRLRRGLSL